ncbi:MAG TPA: HipA domain-containing protein [Solirubrobacteraceae bacterium]|nr:HipA domain-containing protein [Solirubrobacteraceae bacterium]
MTSEQPTEAYVWIWLPDATQPIVAGRLEAVADIVNFNYGRSYLERDDAIALYLPELPLQSGRIPPLSGLKVAGCIADATPDAWGQRMILRRMVGEGGTGMDPASLGPLTYLLQSASDRIGALDFQLSPDEYVARDEGSAPLDELTQAAQRVEEGRPFSPVLDQALLRGSSIGGARPKALLIDGNRKLIAKFSSTTDRYAAVKGEYAAMELACRAGLDVASVALEEVLGKDVLLITRFDRPPGLNQRRAIVSALTILELDEMMARYASYEALAQAVRQRFNDAPGTLRELFGRLTFNILVSNNNDHARNHAAFWDGAALTLTPAFDICPQARAGGETTQAMAITADGFRMSQLAACVEQASIYLLSGAQAREIIDHQIDVIESQWSDVCDLARMSEVERGYFWRRQFLNPYALESYAHTLGAP